MLVTEADVAEIVRLGTLARPAEACGLLLTAPRALRRIAEVPNRAPDPSKDCLMLGPDMLDALRGLVGDPERYQGSLSRELVVWHTHPGGAVGPSKTDMDFRKTLGDVRCLVVSLPDGEAVQF